MSAKREVALGSFAFELYAPITGVSIARRDNSPACAKWFQNQGVAFASDRKPSIAASRVFAAFRKEHTLYITLKQLDRDPVVISAQLFLVLGPFDAPPMRLVEGCEPMREVLSHFFRMFGDEVIVWEEDEITADTDDVGATNPGADGTAVSCGFLACLGACVSRDKKDRSQFHLDRVFEDCTTDKPDESLANENHQSNVVHATLGDKDRISRLPVEVHKNLISFLSAPDVTSLGKTSRTFHSVTRHIVPGLELKLYPHQRIGLDRMRAMERNRTDKHPMPMIRQLPIELDHGHAVAADMCDGSIFLVDSLPLVSSPRGGMICDEPGLGKTITGLALILKTLGQMASPPAGFEKRFITKMLDGMEVTFPCYTEKTNARFTAYGDASLLRTPPRQSRILDDSIEASGALRNGAGMKRTARTITPTKFFQRGKGRGSLPMAQTSSNVIYLSSATLVLAPRMLVKHWQTQIVEHTTAGALKVLVVRKIDDLPGALTLARNYDVIIVSFSIMNTLYSRMRREIPSILQVRFLRVIMDEGHKLGSSRTTQLEYFPRVCASLKAERRWIMTGTPTPSTPYSDVKYLHPLLQFIQESTYGLDTDAWVHGIQKPYETFKPEALERLKELMKKVMIRTSKEHIKTIPKLNVESIMLDFSEDSAKSYNELVTVVSRNLITSDWFRESHEESLLNQKNKSECGLVLTNLRRSCCFGGIIQMIVEKGDLVECLDKLYYFSRSRDYGALPHIRAKDRVEQVFSVNRGEQVVAPPNAAQVILSGHNIPPIFVPNENPNFHPEDRYITVAPPVQSGDKAMSHLRLKVHYRGRLRYIAECFMQGGKCECCSADTRLPFVTPCCHIVCNQCLINCREKCPLPSCGTPYTLDSAGVPEELIELQPAMNSLSWVPSWDQTKSSKMEHLVKKLQEIPKVKTERNGQEVLIPKKVIVYSQFTEHLMLTAIELKKHPILKNSYCELFTNERDVSAGRKKNLDLYLDGQLEKFKNDPNVFVLLMGTSRGSVGLDLSFVEYMVLLEPFWDAALEKQVISRAHRMGAQAPVNVERLVMKDSVEAEMLTFNEMTRNGGGGQSHGAGGSGVGKVKTHQEYLKRKDLLLRLNYVQSAKDLRNAEENAKNGGPSNAPERVAHPMRAGYKSRQNALKTGDPRPSRKRPRERIRESARVRRRVSFGDVS